MHAPFGALSKVLVCLDLSPPSEASLPLARAIASAFGSRVRLVHVLESGGVPEAAAPPDALRWEIARTEARRYLSDVAARMASEERLREKRLRIGTAVLQGHPAEQILCHADREGVDLIVMTSHGEKGVTEWSLASTTEKILERARASVLVVPSAASASPAAKEGRLERILLLLDGSPRAESVLPTLERLARERGASVILLHVVPTPVLFEVGPPSREGADLRRRLGEHNERMARRYMATIRARLAREGCAVRAIVERGDPREILPRVAKREGIDLVAFTAHGRTGDRSRCFGDTAGHLLRHAPVPLLMIQDAPQRSAEFAASVRHRREALPLRGSHGVQPS